MNDFLDIAYLKTGNNRQQKAYGLLSKLGIFEKLSTYTPLLTGTIPIGIDIPGSDLDIICQCKDHSKFSRVLTRLFSKENGFHVTTRNQKDLLITVATFQAEGFEIEIFGQDIPTQKQKAYLHMMIEHKILNKMGAAFKADIIQLKNQGLKTEPAFAKLLGLPGDPYEALLTFHP